MKHFLLILSFFLVSNLLAQNEYALQLDGGKSFYLADDNSNGLDVTTEWTFETWIRVESFVSGNYECIMDRRNVFSFYLIQDITAPTGDYAVRFVTRDGSDNIGLSLRSDSHATQTMSFGTWYHLAVTFDGDTSKLYIDETLVDSEANTGWTLASSTSALNIGGRYWGAYQRQLSDALLDEIRISNSARSKSNLQLKNNASPYTSDVNTVTLMNFDGQDEPPVYISGTSFVGNVGVDEITASNYISASETLYLENRAPTIASIGFQWTDEHQKIEIISEINDVNHDDLMLSAVLLDGNASLATSGDTILVTPLTGQSWDGSGEVAVTVSDGSLTDSVHFDFQDLGYRTNWRALSLDGSASIGLNDDANNTLDSLSNSWFLETWINIDSTADPSAWESILDRRTVFSWFIIPDPVEPRGDYALKFGIRNSDALGDTLSSIDHEEVALFFNRWYHIVALYDGNSAQMWIGPQMVDSTDQGSWAFTPSSNALNIGARYWGQYERYLHGQIDEIRLMATPPASRGEWVLNPTGNQYSHDDRTLFTIHFDAGIRQFQYTSGMNFSGVGFFNNFSSSHYSDVSTDLPLDGANTNQAPFIYPHPDIVSEELDNLEFRLFAWDYEEADLSWTLTSPLPDGMLFEQQGNVARVTWSPTLHQAGDYEVTFEVSDGIAGKQVTLRGQP